MIESHKSTFARFARFGVVHREEVKNNLQTIHTMERLGMVRRVRKRKRVFYELTQQAIPLLESQRRIFLEQIRQRAFLSPQATIYPALLEDIRFVNERHPMAKEFLFLGNWDLQRPVARFQLELAQHRYYNAYAD